MGINLGFNSPQKPQLNQALWSDIVFRTNQYNEQLRLKYEKEQNSKFELDPPEEKTASLNLMDQFQTPNSPEDFEMEFENPPADSGEMESEKKSEILLDPTNFLNDSTGVTIDTTGQIPDSLKAGEDTVKVDWRMVDSTARLEQFHFQREDKPYVDLRVKKESKFFIQPSSNLKTRTVRIDSTGQFVEIVEKIGTTEPKVMLRMPIDDYINMKIALEPKRRMGKTLLCLRTNWW